MFVSLCLLDVMVCLGTGQHHLRAPWRHRIQWENNGQVYSLLSTGTQYRLPAQTRRRTQLLLTTKNTFNPVNPPVALSRSTRTRSAQLESAAGGHFPQNDHSPIDTSILGADADQYLLASGRPGTRSQSPARLETTREPVRYHPVQESSNSSAAAASTAIQEFSGSGVPRGGRSTPGGDNGAQRASASPGRSPDFTHSSAGRIRSEGSDSTSRSPDASQWIAMAEDGGNPRRVPQQTSLGDTRSVHNIQRAHSLTRLTSESRVSPTALSSNAVEIHFPRRRQDTSHTTEEASDPRDPHSIHHRNSVFYNVYPPDNRNRITRPSPGTGYGTRFFHNGEGTKSY